MQAFIGGVSTVRRLGLIFALIVMLGITVSSAQNATPCKGATVRDPVCSLCVEKDPRLSTVYKGETFYFCTEKDAKTFKENPAKYANNK